MVVGDNPRADDMDVNVTSEKKLTNMRSSTADIFETLARPLELGLEQAHGVLRARTSASR